MHIVFRLLFSLSLFYLTPFYSPALASEDMVRDLLRQGSQYQQQGFYLDARKNYQLAYQLAFKSDNIKDQALTQTALGYSEYLLNHAEKAQPLIQKALDYANKSQDMGLLALTQYYLGILHQAQNHPEQATTLLLQSLPYAKALSDALLISRIHIALAQSATQEKALIQHQQQAIQALKTVKQPYLTGELFLLLVEQGLDNALFSSNQSTETATTREDKNRHLANLYQLLQDAHKNIAPNNQRQLAQHDALKARLYESQQRYSEAQQLTQQAIQRLHSEKAQDLLMFYEWQAARLYQALEKNQLALASYRRAIRYVQSIRQDIPVRYHNGKSSFLEFFGPLYRGMIALLLEQAGSTQDSQLKNTQLAEVQTILERLKQTELEDFFKDRCLLTDINTQSFTVKQNQVAILYPIVLSDHIELLLNIGKNFYQHTVPVSSERFEQTVRDYAGKLRKGIEENSNRQLYDWLIRPIASQLEQHHIDTLVYIPDGALRLLPIASLHDGKHYLIEQYAISTLPSLAILPPKQAKKSSSQALLVGLSEPTVDTVAQLPQSLLSGLIGESVTQLPERSLLANKSLRSVSSKLRKINTQGDHLTRQIKLEKMAQALALPGVKEEIELLSEELSSYAILNQDYTLNNFDQLAEQPQYDTIHIASHGFFGSNSDESFIMSYDKLLTIDHLETLLTKRGSKDPIDLLVLSACQTAEGDDRAPLGLSGIALKAKANTALGSLWPISDEAAVEIMKAFYNGLKQQGLSKAKALQQAQQQGLLERDIHLIKPTEKGQRYLNSLIELFLP